MWWGEIVAGKGSNGTFDSEPIEKETVYLPRKNVRYSCQWYSIYFECAFMLCCATFFFLQHFAFKHVWMKKFSNKIRTSFGNCNKKHLRLIDSIWFRRSNAKQDYDIWYERWWICIVREIVNTSSYFLWIIRYRIILRSVQR